jgi:HEAT repeat protein
LRPAILFFLMVLLCSCNGEQDAPGSPEDTGEDHPYVSGFGDEEAPPADPEPEPETPQYTRMQHGPAYVGAQIEKLAHADAQQRSMAIMSIPANPGHFEKHPELLAKVRDALVEVATDDPTDENRAHAINKLAQMGEKVGPAMPDLIKRLEHPTDCQHVCFALRQMGKAGHAAIPRMIDLLKDGPEANRVHLVDGLGRLGPDGADAVPALTEIVRSGKKDFLRVKAAHALGKIGPKAKSSLEVLDENAQTGPGNLRYACKAAADRIRKN